MKKRTRIGALALVLAAAGGSAIFARHLSTAPPGAAAQRGRCEGAPVVDTLFTRPVLPGMRFFKVL